MWRLKLKINKHSVLIGSGVLLIIMMLLAISWFLFFQVPLIVQGEVEATQVRVASKIVGRVDSLHIKEGDWVSKGQALVSLYSPEIEAKLKQATAAKRAASAQKDKADIGARKEQIQAAYNLWQTAKAQSDFAEKTFERVKKLYKDGVVSAQKYDEAQAKLRAAQQQTQAANASYNMAVSGARVEDKQAASALFDRATGAVAEVEAYIDETNLKTPISGEVAEIIPKTGELISSGYPIVNIIDLKDIWVTFNLREDLLANIRMDSILVAIIPALGNREINLKVNYITALGSYATWTSTKSTGDFDMKTFEVRATPVEDVEGLRPGMSALVEWEK